MRYIFNVLVNEATYEINFQDVDYTLAGTNHMGEVDFYTYQHEGSESLLISPTFLLQFWEAAKRIKPLRSVTTSKAAKIRLFNLFDGKLTETVYEEGKDYEYVVRFKDIDLTMTLKGGKFELTPYMHIYSEKLIDSRLDIDLSEIPEFREYFSEEVLEG